MLQQNDVLSDSQAQTITLLFPLDGSGQQGHLAQCTAVDGAGLSRGQLLNVIYNFYQVAFDTPICARIHDRKPNQAFHHEPVAQILIISAAMTLQSNLICSGFA